MLAEKILKNLENGNYRVEYREECECDFYWYEKYGELACEIVRADGTCYYNNVLIMDDLAGQFDGTIGVRGNGAIVAYDPYHGVNLQILCLDRSIEKQIRRYILDDYSEIYLQLIASINYPFKCNEKHEKRKIQSLLEYVGWYKDN